MIEPYLTDTVTWVRDQGTDQWGEPNTPVEESLACRIQHRIKMVRDRFGQEAVSTAKLLMLQQPSAADQFTFDGRKHPVLQIHRMASFETSHYEVFVA